MNKTVFTIFLKKPLSRDIASFVFSTKNSRLQKALDWRPRCSLADVFRCKRALRTNRLYKRCGTKNNCFHYGRNIRQTREQLLDAFYGIPCEDDGEERKETEEEENLRLGVTPELVQCYTRHAKDCCEELIKLDELLVGKPANLNLKKPSELQMQQQDNEANDQALELADETDTYFAEVELDDEEDESGSESESDDEDSQ